MAAPPASRSFSTQVLRSPEAFAGIADEWERCNAAFAQSCCEGHLDHLLHTHRSTDGSHNLMAVLLYENGGLAGMAPLAMYRHHVTWQLRLRRRRWPVVSFAMSAVEFIGDRLIVRDDPDARQALLQGIIEACRPFDLVRFRYLLVDREPWSSITSSARARGGRWAWTLHRDVSMGISVRESFDAYERTRSPKPRRNMRRETRLLEAAGGTSLTLALVTEPSEVPSFLEAAGRVFEHSWHARHGATYIGATPETVARFRWLASRGWLRAYLLSKGEEPIAFIFGCQYRRVFTASRAAFAQSWSRYSPGKVLWWKAIEHMHQSGTVDRINFGIGDWEYKRVLATDTQQVSNVWLIRPSLRNAVAWSGPWVYRSLRNTAEKGLRMTSAGDRLMKWLRRHMAR